MEISKNQKTTAYVAAGALILILLYRHFAAGNTAGQVAATGSAAPDSSQYAALAGQEQSDAASLQAQEQSDIAGLTAQHQADLADVSKTVQANQASEQQDVAAIVANDVSLGSTLASAQNAFQTSMAGQLAAALAQEGQTIAGLASGQTQLNRSIIGLQKTAALGKPGAVPGPYGPKRPADKKGFTIRGLGQGFWAYIPVVSKKAATKQASKGGVKATGGAGLK